MFIGGMGVVRGLQHLKGGHVAYVTGLGTVIKGLFPAF
jgi:hypothetical protein